MNKCFSSNRSNSNHSKYNDVKDGIPQRPTLRLLIFVEARREAIAIKTHFCLSNIH